MISLAAIMVFVFSMVVGPRKADQDAFSRLKGDWTIASEEYPNDSGAGGNPNKGKIVRFVADDSKGSHSAQATVFYGKRISLSEIRCDSADICRTFPGRTEPTTMRINAIMSVLLQFNGDKLSIMMTQLTNANSPSPKTFSLKDNPRGIVWHLVRTSPLKK